MMYRYYIYYIRNISRYITSSTTPRNCRAINKSQVGIKIVIYQSDPHYINIFSFHVFVYFFFQLKSHVYLQYIKYAAHIVNTTQPHIGFTRQKIEELRITFIFLIVNYLRYYTNPSFRCINLISIIIHLHFDRTAHLSRSSICLNVYSIENGELIIL